MNTQNFQYPVFRPVPKGPSIVHLDLANACNLDCISCWNHSPLLKKKKSTQWKKMKMDTKLAVSLLNEFKDLETKRFIFSGGGEIFLHPDINEIIQYAGNLGEINLTLITNLLLCKDLDFLINNNVDTLLVNFHAATPGTYKAFHPRSSEKFFHALIEKIKYLAAKKIRVKLVSVINRINHREIADIILLAHKLDAGIQFKLASMAEGTEPTLLSKSQKAKLIARMPKFKKLAKKLQVKQTNLDVLENQLYGKKAHRFPIEDIGCYAGFFYTRIQTNGDVHYCCKPIQMGNISGKNFRDIWKGDQYKKMRKKLAKGKFFPFCQSCGKYDLNYQVHKNICEV